MNFSLVAVGLEMHSDTQARTKDGRFAAAGSDGVWAVEEKSSAVLEVSGYNPNSPAQLITGV